VLIQRRIATATSARVLTRSAFLALTALALFLAPAAWAAEDSAYLDYRQKVMSGVGANMGAISDILKNGLPFTGHIEDHAEALAETAKLIAPAFEHRVVDGPTDALPKIWDDWAGFEKAIADFKDAAKALEDAADKGDMAAIGAKTKALGKSCGGCHRTYRKDKEDSYKRK